MTIKVGNKEFSLDGYVNDFQKVLVEIYQQGRADAIDEFANALINDGKVSAMRVLKIKEQLKENKNENNKKMPNM